MRLLIVPFFTCLAGLSLLGYGLAQGITDRESMLHKNVKLAEVTVSSNIPAAIAKQYREVLPVFR